MTVEAAPLFSPAEVKRAQRDLANIASDWISEWPMRLHDSGRGRPYGLGSSPPFAPEFIGFIGTLTCKNEYCTRCRRRKTSQPDDNYSGRDTRRRNTRVRATRAFRQLRKHAPLEYDVLWMAVMYHLDIEQITERLNARAIKRGYPERYTMVDVGILAMSGIDKVNRWY